MADTGLLNNPNLYGDDMADVKKPAADLFRELGVPSPQEKQAAAMQQQQLMQALQQARAQQAQQMMMQRAQMGTGFGFPVLTAMGGNTPQTPPGGGFLGLNKPQGQPQQPQGVDPNDPSQIISQEMAASPNDRGGALKRAGVKLLQMAIQRGDGDLQKIAANTISKGQQYQQEDQKAQLGNMNTASEIGSREQEMTLKKAQASNADTPFEMNLPNGNKGKFVQVKDENGKVVDYKYLGGGPEKLTTTTVDDPRTQTQKGEEYMGFQKLLTNSGVAMQNMAKITQTMKDGAAQGWAGSAVSFLDNAIGTLGQMAPGSSLDAGAQKAMAGMQGNFSEWAKKTGVNESRWQDLVANVAKTYNSTGSGGGGTISENDIKRAAKAVGASFSNPGTVAAILDDAKDRLVSQVGETYDNMGDGAREASKAQYERFQGKYATARPHTEEEYKALPKGTWYWNPSLNKRVQKKN